MDELKGWVELPLAPEEFMDLSALGAGPDRLLIRADAFARILVAWQEKKQEKKLLAKLAEVIHAKDSDLDEWEPWDKDAAYCPRCGSGERGLTGMGLADDVATCPHPWHRAGAQTDPEPTPVSVWHPPRGSASWRAYNALSNWVEKADSQKLAPGRYNVLGGAPWIVEVPGAEASDLLVRPDGALVLRSGLPAVVPNGYGKPADSPGA